MNRILAYRGAPKSSTVEWARVGSCEVADFGCVCRIYLEIRSEAGGLWSIRCCNTDQFEVIGPNHLDSLAEELVEDLSIDRDDLLNLFSTSGVEALEKFAQQNRLI